MMKNPQQTAEWIYNQITMHPDTHNQSSFEGKTGCKTTRCVAGWAQYLHEGSVFVGFDKNRMDVVDAAMEYLGLDPHDANSLFYQTNDREAVKALEYLVRGERIDWPEVYQRNSW